MTKAIIASYVGMALITATWIDAMDRRWAPHSHVSFVEHVAEGVMWPIVLPLGMAMAQSDTALWACGMGVQGACK